MISAVLNANTLVSATLSAKGLPHQVVLAAYARRFRLITSSVIVTEVVRTLGLPRILRRYPVTLADLQTVQDLLAHEAVTTPLTVDVRGVATHPEDDLILATAVSAQADYLVSYDKQLLALGSFRGTTIVSPKDFLGILDVQTP